MPVKGARYIHSISSTAMALISYALVAADKDNDLIEPRRPGDIVQVPGSTYG